MKNSLVTSWKGLSKSLMRNNSEHLDLRKMLNSGDPTKMWNDFSMNIGSITCLKRIDFCKCSSEVLVKIFCTNTQLEIVNAVMINDKSIDLSNLMTMTQLVELRLRSIHTIEVSSFNSIAALQNLKHLSLTSVSNFDKFQTSVLSSLQQLESLELGDCLNLSNSFILDALQNLDRLKRLRFEKCEQPFDVNLLLDTLSMKRNLVQLELINFDVVAGFDEYIAKCIHITRLHLIPTYVQQSATTNQLILKGIMALRNSLKALIWNFTTELLKVTELYRDSIIEDSIPILKPVPKSYNENFNLEVVPFDSISQIEILSVASVENMIRNYMQDTKIKLTKVHFASTWKQTMSDF